MTKMRCYAIPSSPLQVFGPPGVEAVYKELQQLHERKVGEPRDASMLSPTQKRNALGYLMFLKQKRTGLLRCPQRKNEMHWAISCSSNRNEQGK